MNKHDRIISSLMDALDAIRRAAALNASPHYIAGIATQAIINADTQRERNSDGYLVVKE